MRADLIRFLRLLGPYRGQVARLLALEVLVTVTYRLEPLYLLVFVNEVTLKSNLNLLIAVVVAMISCALAAYYFYGVAKYHRARLGQKVLAEVRRLAFAHILKQPPEFLDAHPPGKLVALTTAEVDALDSISEAFFWGLQTVFAIGFIFAICFAIDRELALLLLAPLPILGLLLTVDGRMRARNQVALERQSRLTAFLKQRLSHLPTVQAFQRERVETGRLGHLADELVEARARTEQQAQLSQRLFELSQALVLAAVLAVGGLRFVHREGVTLGAITAVFAYANGLFIEVTAMYGYLVRARLATVALRRIFALVDAVPAIRDPEAAAELPRARGRVTFANVSFRYAGAETDALRDVSLDVQPGELVALVGLSGSGKSTVFRLLMRFHDPRAGAVLLDGRDLRGHRIDSVRAQLALATQEAVVFPGTVADNISYGRETATRAEIVAAARVAVAHDFIERLPLGYDTVIGEGGADLSGGQRHRIALARAVLRDAPVLLLDEVTAGLDAKTEAELQQALVTATRGRTTLVIAHRLGTVMRADRILVWDRGRIVQSGTHAELLADESGLYRFLFERQFKDPLRGPTMTAPHRIEPPV
jgi:ABC-type multidrug transport system fused ATPase/permease subunit